MKTRYLWMLAVSMLLATTNSSAQNSENSNPYAIFGCTPYVAGDKDAGETAEKVFVIENFSKGSKVARIEHNPQTGRVRLLNKRGKLFKEKLLKACENGWLTQDRFAEKYYSLSPYSYAAGNPIKYIDINGDSLWINHKGVNVLYVDGKLYNKDGSNYTGKVNKFMRKTISALGSISGTSTGASMVSELQGSENNFTIMKGDNRFEVSNRTAAYAAQAFESIAMLQGINAGALFGGSGGTIYWSPNGASVPTTTGYSNDPAMVLGHEMAHGWDANRGLLSPSFVDGYSKSEWQAVYNENLMRSQAGLPMRTHYGSGVTPYGTKLGGIGPRMLLPGNLPYVKHYSSYYP